MRKKIVFAVLILFLPAISYGQLVTIAISGQVNYMWQDSRNPLGNAISIGDSVTGTYTYDSEAVDSNPSLESGLYYHSNSLYGISLYIGGLNFKTDPTNVDFLVSVGNWSSGTDNYGLLSYRNLPLSNGALVDEISWQLTDPTGTALSNDVLPLIAPDLSKWHSNGLTIDSDRESGFRIGARITSATLVPEPISILLFGLGMMLARKHFSK